ncbi:uncharacterized protein TRAVEDRAFT_70009 [Trametes versicolor FP-101664 SS1]|uniref:uncharacterized protein n=1 Tax=Trametes versicolor (strain FP-101664) TaxID=717944 RepID=UPI00046214F6|nr:uncharacterized protein TRAVEDRAFT_70009 [Trametes versicolor FP-101664 SS1]EIW61709.1 hypothetical protein TRAVEDRAFT_70009 [Trametes versicolor FP-101664 SS1]
MSDEEDDYLSDKFLVAAASTSTSVAPKTYAQRRKEAQAAAAARNAENRKLGARAAREDALSRSLFERAQEEARESGQQNKALAMMMKMGFKPGQALGKEEEAKANKGEDGEEAEGSGAPAVPAQASEQEEDEPRRAGIGARQRPKVDADEEAEKPQATSSGHRIVPIGISEWEGKKGIGLRKRAASPSAPERRAKMAKMAEDRDHTSFRDRARAEYEERRAVGQLGPAQRTCATLDEKAGIEFNVLWLSPEHPETFPEGLLDALDDPVLVATIQRQRADHSLEGRLRAKMQADALRPLKSTLDDVDADADDSSADKAELLKAPYSEEDLGEALQFLRLNPRDRLTLVLDYLRRKYTYCFWCGTQYDGLEDMESNCPGAEEDAHD